MLTYLLAVMAYRPLSCASNLLTSLSASSFVSLPFSLRFRVGPSEVHNFRMIERHYHNGTGALMKSYDFNFSFCIPNSTNESDRHTLQTERTVAQLLRSTMQCARDSHDHHRPFELTPVSSTCRLACHLAAV
jgi:hypothetical protein